MSKDKYPSTFSPQMEVIVFIILQTFFAKHPLLKSGNISQFSLGNIWSRDAFRPIVRERRYLMDYKLGCLSSDIICSEKRTLFCERSSRNTVSFEERTQSEDKYHPSIFSAQKGRYCFYYPSNLFCNACRFENSRMFSDIPQFLPGNIRSRDMFRPIAHERKYLMDYNCIIASLS